MVKLNGMSAQIAVAEFYAGKSVFITGGTGFLGKVLIEKLLYSCPAIQNIYVLIRNKKNVTPEKRIQILLDHVVFTRIKRESPKVLNKVLAIAGDLSQPNLGLSEADEKLLTTKVTIVIHAAATIKFNEPLEMALAINVEGTRGILNLCHRMQKCDAYVHVSTAYTNTDKKVVQEKVYPPPASLDEVYDYVKKYRGNEVELAKILNRLGFHLYVVDIVRTAEEYNYLSANVFPDHYNLDLFKAIVNRHFLDGRPNTYTYTKALAEYLVKQNCGDLPVAIVRPSIVLSTMKDPIVGWLENWNGPTLVMYGISRGIHRFQVGGANNVADIVPVDMVTNMTIAAGARCQRSRDLIVYNCTSGKRNPLTYGNFIKWYVESAKARNFNDFPCPGLLLSKSVLLIGILKFIFATLPALFGDLILRIIGKEPQYAKILAKIRKAEDLLVCFTSNQWDFNDENVRALIKSLSVQDQHTFYCDPTDIKWKSLIDDYFLGVSKYLLKKL